ncbi:hypothetical protein LWM68_19855 [Niabella sp. W65]|nr:hypothetical protein [Niabella sp. W65]MCH7364816.1 hypothetical protein [Niabella sp. W65]
MAAFKIAGSGHVFEWCGRQEGCSKDSQQENEHLPTIFCYLRPLITLVFNLISQQDQGMKEVRYCVIIRTAIRGTEVFAEHFL